MGHNSGMTKFMVGLVSGVLLAIVLALVLVVVVIVMAVSGAQPTIADGSVLALELKGGVPEHHTTNFSFEWIDEGPPRR